MRAADRLAQLAAIAPKLRGRDQFQRFALAADALTEQLIAEKLPSEQWSDLYELAMRAGVGGIPSTDPLRKPGLDAAVRVRSVRARRYMERVEAEVEQVRSQRRRGI